MPADKAGYRRSRPDGVGRTGEAAGGRRDGAQSSSAAHRHRWAQRSRGRARPRGPPRSGRLMAASIPLALLGALLFAASAALQHGTVRRAALAGARLLGLLRSLAREPLWL